MPAVWNWCCIVHFRPTHASHLHNVALLRLLLIWGDRHQGQIDDKNTPDYVVVANIDLQLRNKGLLSYHGLFLLLFILEHSAERKLARLQFVYRLLGVSYLVDCLRLLYRNANHFIVSFLKGAQTIDLSFYPVRYVDEGVLEIIRKSFQLLLQMIIAWTRNQSYVSELSNLAWFFLLSLLVSL